MKWHVLAVQNVPLHQQAGRNQDIANYVSDIVRSHPRMGAGEKETSQNHDDMPDHLEVERPLQKERTMTMLLKAKLRELVGVIMEKPAASDVELGEARV